MFAEGSLVGLDPLIHKLRAKVCAQKPTELLHFNNAKQKRGWETSKQAFRENH